MNAPSKIFDPSPAAAAFRTNPPPPIAPSISSQPPPSSAARRNTDIRRSPQRKHRAPTLPAIRVHRRASARHTESKSPPRARTPPHCPPSHRSQIDGCDRWPTHTRSAAPQKSPAAFASAGNARSPDPAQSSTSPAGSQSSSTKHTWLTNAPPPHCNREPESPELSASL